MSHVAPALFIWNLWNFNSVRENGQRWHCNIKICLFAVKLFEDHGIKVDRAELLSLSIFEVKMKFLFYTSKWFVTLYICVSGSIPNKNRSNFGEVDVAPAKTWKMTKLTKWKSDKKITAGLNPNHMHIFKPWKKDVQNCIKIGMKSNKELRLHGTRCLYTFIESAVRKWQSSQSGKSDKT